MMLGLFLLGAVSFAAAFYCVYKVGYHHAMARCCNDVSEMMFEIGRSSECTPGPTMDVSKVNRAILERTSALGVKWSR